MDDTERLIQVRAARLARLHLLEVQEAQRGSDTPPHITIELASLRRSLGLVDAAVASPLDDDIVEQLGASGRYRATDTRLKRLEKGIAFLGARLEASIEEARMWRKPVIVIGIVIGIVVILILMITTGIVTYLVTRSGM